MHKFYRNVIRFRVPIMLLFLIGALVCAWCRQYIQVNYNMNDYLPATSPSTVALETMEEEFDSAIPNARVMMPVSDRQDALNFKQKLLEVHGVTAVTWLDDTSISENLPFEMYPASQLDTYYKDGYALYTVTIDETQRTETVTALYAVIGEDGALTGSAVDTAVATSSTVSEVSRIAAISVLFLLFILLLTSTSWVEPLVVLAGLGTAILINSGSNLIFGEISFVTNSAGNILQLAVSLDYSVFLIHRFQECRRGCVSPEAAMEEALCCATSSIFSSGLTTVIGFLALVMMQFRIGPDLGLALAKGVAISLVTVFLFMPGLILTTFRWIDRTKHRSFMPSFTKIGRLISCVMIPMVLVFTLFIVPAYRLSGSNSYYYGASHIFGADTRLGGDKEKIESVFGKTDTYVVLVPTGDRVTESALAEELENLPQMRSVTSLVSLLGPSLPTEMVPDSIRSKLQSERYDRLVLTVNAAYEGENTFSLVQQIRQICGSYYPDAWYLAGQGVSTYDLMDTVTADMVKVNLLAVAAVFVVLLLTQRSFVLSAVLVLTIETAIWINMAIPCLMQQPVFYIAYLIISSVQLGATVDYAILFNDRYRENRAALAKKEAVQKTVRDVMTSILTSGIVMTGVGILLGTMSTHGLLSQLGYFLGRGTICSMIAVLFVLPGYLYLFDRFAVKRSR